MLFNSITFAAFLPIVFAIYWFLFKSNYKAQNILLLLTSYVFYGWWDYRFVGLLIASTIIDFWIGLRLGRENNPAKRKILLSLSLLANIGILAYFKYFNFFLNSWQEAWNTLGVDMDFNTWKIILPVGISFYTFQTLSYTIDIYRRQFTPTKSFVQFAAFVSFFPQLVAGPIERAAHLLPQFSRRRYFDLNWSMSGIHLILWGLFKKIVIADSLGPYVTVIFDNYEDLNAGTLILGAVYFAFQIYADFSGYSDIAIGTARLFGFDLMQNFNYPYFSRNIGEFWRRWHISLSTWFRDYLYIPLGGSRGGIFSKIRNTFAIFLISGLWHGASWTFVFWGGLNAVFFFPLLIMKNNRKFLDQVATKSFLPSLKETIQIFSTFSLVTFAWIFFRAEDISTAFAYIARILQNLEFRIEYLSNERYNIELLLLLLIFITFEWIHRRQEHPFTGKWYWFKISIIILFLLTLGVYSRHQDFIYFQF